MRRWLLRNFLEAVCWLSCHPPAPGLHDPQAGGWSSAFPAAGWPASRWMCAGGRFPVRRDDHAPGGRGRRRRAADGQGEREKRPCSFVASNNVTHTEMIALFMRAVGVDAEVKGAWPTNCGVYGADWGITDDAIPLLAHALRRAAGAPASAPGALATFAVASGRPRKVIEYRQRIRSAPMTSGAVGSALDVGTARHFS